MIDAYNHYNDEYNNKFTSYAYPYIAGEIKKFMRENRLLKTSRDLIYLASRIECASNILRQQLLREPNIDDLSNFLEIDAKKIIEALHVNNYVQSIDEPLNDDGKELTLKDIISIEEKCDYHDLLSLREELSKLSSKEKELIKRRYYEGQTQNEVAKTFGISQVEVSRNEKKLILNLRSKLKS